MQGQLAQMFQLVSYILKTAVAEMSVLFVSALKIGLKTYQTKAEPLPSSNEYLQLFQRPAVK